MPLYHPHICLGLEAGRCSINFHLQENHLPYVVTYLTGFAYFNHSGNKTVIPYSCELFERQEDGLTGPTALHNPCIISGLKEVISWFIIIKVKNFLKSEYELWE